MSDPEELFTEPIRPKDSEPKPQSRLTTPHEVMAEEKTSWKTTVPRGRRSQYEISYSDDICDVLNHK